jgi:hypothetical protein
MKTTRILRLLSLLGFLLLLAPFYDSCDGNYPFKRIPEDGIIIKKSFSEKVYDLVIVEEAFNGFEIATLFPIGIQEFNSFNEFKEETSKSFQKKDWYKSLGMIISILFDFIIFLSLLILIFSFTNKINTLNKLAVVNTIFILLTFFYIIFLESSFEHFHQIKWGYYAFIITNVLIFYYSKPNIIKT